MHTHICSTVSARASDSDGLDVCGCVVDVSSQSSQQYRLYYHLNCFPIYCVLLESGLPHKTIVIDIRYVICAQSTIE